MRHHVIDVLAPIIVALVYIAATSLFKEPPRRNFNAIMVAGAGAAYLNGGFGPWEFVFCAVATVFAYRGLQSYAAIGVAWLLHTGWDVLHHLYGTPIVPFWHRSQPRGRLATSPCNGIAK